ncbi:MAG TPA: hypothetical protein VFZ66_01040 [Herpetosiphonaceae bacterium]
MSALLRLVFLFALTVSLIVPDGRIFAYEPDTTWEASRPLTKLILAAPGQTHSVVYDGATIELGAQAVATDTPISITPLAQQELPTLDAGMTTLPTGRAGATASCPTARASRSRFGSRCRMIPR